MVRRVVMWIAVTSLASLAILSSCALTISFFVPGGSSGWTFYSPYSHVNSNWMQASYLCSYACRILYPLAAGSSAAYIYLAERAILQQFSSRGFAVEVAPRADARV